LNLNTLLIGPFFMANVDSFVLRDTGAAFVARQGKVPWSYLGTNFGNRYETGVIADPTLDPAAQVDERSLWGTDLVIRLHDHADGGGGGPGEPNNRLRLRIELTGHAPNGRKITERIWIANTDKSGGFVGDAYYRTKFAYAQVKVRLLEFYGAPNQSDYLYIGFNYTHQYSASNRTNARSRDRKYGIPWRCRYLEDIMCIKCDSTPTGEGLNGIAFPNNCRGIYPIDLVEDGAIYDPEDGSILINDCDELKNTLDYDAAGEAFALEIEPSSGKHFLVFQVDPRNPQDVQKQDTPLFYDNEIDFYAAPINP
jgi:hypothetical protein